MGSKIVSMVYHILFKELFMIISMQFTNIKLNSVCVVCVYKQMAFDLNSSNLVELCGFLLDHTTIPIYTSS